MTLEVCVADLHSLQAAVRGGAHRVELCSDLEQDGLTPNSNLVRKAVEADIAVHVLIRPRGGNFVYNEEEAMEMLSSIRMARSLGADGVVIGALTPEGDVDMPLCRRLMQEAEGMNVTFHRAFDVCRNPSEALEQIISLGANRLLTSGQCATAEEGIPLLRELVRQSAGRISIMPGSGVSAENAAHILQQTGATEIHGTLRRGGVTDTAIVAKIVELMKE